MTTLSTRPENIARYRATLEKVINTFCGGVDLETSLGDYGVAPQFFYAALRTLPDLGVMYADAKRYRAEKYAQEVVGIADTETDQLRARNRITARQWYASKVLAQEYGDKLEVNVTQHIDIGSALIEARARALRPVSDQYTDVEAHTVDLIEESQVRPTDTESDDGPVPAFVPVSTKRDRGPRR